MHNIEINRPHWSTLDGRCFLWLTWIEPPNKTKNGTGVKKRYICFRTRKRHLCTCSLQIYIYIYAYIDTPASIRGLVVVCIGDTKMWVLGKYTRSVWVFGGISVKIVFSLNFRFFFGKVVALGRSMDENLENKPSSWTIVEGLVNVPYIGSISPPTHGQKGSFMKPTHVYHWIQSLSLSLIKSARIWTK